MEELNKPVHVVHLGWLSNGFTPRNIDYAIPQSWGCLAVTREASEAYALHPVSQDIVYGQRSGDVLRGVGVKQRVEVVLISPEEAGFREDAQIVDEEDNPVNIMSNVFIKARTLRIEIGCDLVSEEVQDTLEALAESIEEDEETSPWDHGATDDALVQTQALTQLLVGAAGYAVEQGLYSHYERRRHKRLIRTAMLAAGAGVLALFGTDVLSTNETSNLMEVQAHLAESLVVSYFGLATMYWRLRSGLLSPEQAKAKNKSKATDQAANAGASISKILSAYHTRQSLDAELNKMLQSEDDGKG